MTEPVITPAARAPGAAAYGADAVIVCDNIVRIFQTGSIEVQALQGLDLVVQPGEMVAIVGASGSGKSTLLGILSGLDLPTAGRATVAGHDLLTLSARQRVHYRREVVGFIWQQTSKNLLPYLTAAENIGLALSFTGASRARRRERTAQVLEALGIAELAARRPHEMSGGQQQRVAIGVALANEPAVLLADEPTGELDSATSDDVFEALRTANRVLGTTVVIVTHDASVSGRVQRTIAIRDGRTSTEVVRRTVVDDAGAETVHAEEFALLDRAGRMQVPAAYRERLGLRDRVRLELESDHVGVFADRAAESVEANSRGADEDPDTDAPSPTEDGSSPLTDHAPSADDPSLSPFRRPRRARTDSTDSTDSEEAGR